MKCLIYIISPVSSSKTSMSICMGNLRLAQFSGVIFCCVTYAHNSIASQVLDKKRVFLCVLCDGACDRFSLTLVLVASGTLGSAVVSNFSERRRGCTLGGGGGSNLGGGTLLCIGGSTLVGGACPWDGCCAVGLGVWSSCTSVSCISCVRTPGNCRGAGLCFGCFDGGVVAV